MHTHSDTYIYLKASLFKTINNTSYTVEPVYNGHPWDQQKWLLYYRGDLIIQSGFHVIN